MPRIIEPPDEFVETSIAIEDNERSQRSTDLPAPEAFIPRASPVDLSRGAPVTNSKLLQLQGISAILESAVGSGRQSLQFFDNLQERTQERERNEVGLAMEEAEVIEKAPPGPLRRFFQGANPFIGQGRNEQFGENTRIRASAAFETALIAERARRAEARARGEDPGSLETPEEVLGFAHDYFDTEMLNHELGRDPHFQRGFQEDLRADLEGILQREEVSRRERVVDEAMEAGAQQVRELIAAQLMDTTDSILPTALQEGVQAWVETNAAVGLGTEDELATVAIAAAGTDLLDRVRRGQWSDLGPSELSSIRAQMMHVAGADTDNRARVSDMFERVQSAIDTAQVDAAKRDELLDDEYEQKLRTDIIEATAANDNETARKLSLELARLTGDAGAASTALEEALSFSTSIGSVTANEAAFNNVIEQMDLNGWSSQQVNRYADRLQELGNFVFTADQRAEFRVEQNRNQGRGRVRNDESFKAARRELTEQIARAGGKNLDDGFGSLFGGLTDEQTVTAEAYRQILRAFDQRVIAQAMDAGGIETIRSLPEWGEILRKEADGALRRIDSVAKTSNNENGPELRRALVERLRLEQEARDRIDSGQVEQIQTAPITEEEKTRSIKAVREIQRIDRIVNAFPENAEPETPLLSPATALYMNGIPAAERDYLRAAEVLQNLPQVETTPPERPPQHSTGGTAFQPLREHNDFVELASND